jgi:peptidoglycan-associated lipoprotein
MLGPGGSFRVGIVMFKTSKSGLTIILALAAALSLSACTKKPGASLTDAANNGLMSDGANGVDGSGLIDGSQAQLAAQAGDKVYFNEDQSSLTAEGKATLVQQAKWLGKHPDVTVQIEGHADERGTREYNISLSARRATTVRSFLLSQGVDAPRIATIAYGKERPAAACDAEECWSQNRRAVTVVTGGGKTS